MPFDPREHMIKVQGGREYLPASARLIWFREEHKDWSVVTKPITVDFGMNYAFFEARILDETGRVIATAHKFEDKFGDFVGKAETGAISRALGYCGYGTQFEAEDDEMAGGQGPRYADSPQPVQPAPQRAPVQPQQAAKAYQQNGGTQRAKQEPAPHPRFHPLADITAAEARLRTMAMFSVMDGKVKSEWLDYIKRTYDVQAIGRVPEDVIGDLYREMAMAVTEVTEADAPPFMPSRIPNNLP